MEVCVCVCGGVCVEVCVEVFVELCVELCVEVRGGVLGFAALCKLWLMPHPHSTVSHRNRCSSTSWRKTLQPTWLRRSVSRLFFFSAFH